MHSAFAMTLVRWWLIAIVRPLTMDGDWVPPEQYVTSQLLRQWIRG